MIRTIAAALATTTCLVAIASPAAAQIREFNVPAGSLRIALDIFARQSGRQVIYRGDVQSARSPGVTGARSAEAALAAILAGSGFAARTDRSGAFAIVKAGNARVAAPRSSVSAAEEPGSPAADDESEAIVVTGTNIRGAEPAGQKLILIDRKEIDRSGYATAQELIRSLPQNFGGNVQETSFQPAGGNQADLSTTGRQSAINLRGLGAESTLVLVDGRRMVTTGLRGVIADVSTIPMSAVERVEILPDGASALYGSDAVGGVVNFVLKKRYDGAETRLHFGTVTSGGQQERLVAQTVGKTWRSGNILVAGQFFDRDALYASERSRSSSDLRPYGGNDYRFTQCNPGTITVAGQTYAIPAGQNGKALNPASLVAGTRNLCDRLPYNTYFPDERQWNVIARLNQEITRNLSFHVDGMYNDRKIATTSSNNVGNLSVPRTNAFYVNPTGGTGNVTVAYDFAADLGPNVITDHSKTWSLLGGLDLELGGGWTAMSYTGPSKADAHQFQVLQPDPTILAQVLASSDPAIAFNPFGAGSNTSAATLDRLRRSQTATTDVENRLWISNIHVAGPLFALPGGSVRLAIGAERRDQTVETETTRITSTATTRTPAKFSRDINAVFGEIFVPIVGQANEAPLVKRLELSFAGRYEDYSDFGGKFSPRIGATWSPAAGLKLRGSWARSFKAPVLADLNQAAGSSYILSVPDPTSSTGLRDTLVWLGGNAGLRPETAESWTAGFDLTPKGIAGLNLSATYFSVDFRDRIGTPPGGAALTTANAPFFFRTPTAEQRQAVCGGSNFLGNFSATAGTCLTAPVPLLDFRLQNLASLSEQGLDASAAYVWSWPAGEFNAGVNATYLFHYKIRAASTVAPLDAVNTEGDPLHLKLRATLGWRLGGFSATGNANFANSYLDTTATPARRIGSWTTFDFNLAYQVPDRGLWPLRGLRLALSVRNAFDKDPPFFNGINTSGGYDSANANFQGRFVGLDLTKSW